MTTAVVAGRRRRPARRWAILVMLTPAILGLLIFFVYPLLASIYYSFTRFDLVSPPQWIGLAQLQRTSSRRIRAWDRPPSTPCGSC